MRLHDYIEYYARENPDHPYAEMDGVVVSYYQADIRVNQIAQALLAGYKIPRKIEFIDQIPRNVTGKILKKDLREPFWQGKQRRVS